MFGVWLAVGSDYGLSRLDQGNMNETAKSQQDPPIEVVTPEVYTDSGTWRGALGGIWSRTLRVKITGRDGVEKLDVRIPVSYCLYSLVDLLFLFLRPSPFFACMCVYTYFHIFYML